MFFDSVWWSEEGWLFLSFVDPALVPTHLDSQTVAAGEVVRLLQFRAIPVGTPVFLDEQTMRPVEPLCSWFRHLAYEDKDVKTLREYSYGTRRFVHFLESRGCGLLQATESDQMMPSGQRQVDGRPGYR